ncbi:protein kinase [Aureococcus anophagefferens]|nr:protein kinase [Aureococcus anophagefferens]
MPRVERQLEVAPAQRALARRRCHGRRGTRRSLLQRRVSKLVDDVRILRQKYASAKAENMDLIWIRLVGPGRLLGGLPAMDDAVVESDAIMGDYRLGATLGVGSPAVVDAWSIGCVALELLLGRQWFSDHWLPASKLTDDPAEFAVALSSALADLAAALRASPLPAEAKSFLESALTEDPDDRPAIGERGPPRVKPSTPSASSGPRRKVTSSIMVPARLPLCCRPAFVLNLGASVAERVSVSTAPTSRRSICMPLK